MRLKTPVHTRGRLWRGSLALSLISSVLMIAVVVAVVIWRGVLPY